MFWTYNIRLKSDKKGQIPIIHPRPELSAETPERKKDTKHWLLGVSVMGVISSL